MSNFIIFCVTGKRKPRVLPRPSSPSTTAKVAAVVMTTTMMTMTRPTMSFKRIMLLNTFSSRNSVQTYLCHRFDKHQIT